eukprot:3149467-Amphidinium_carterae.1
MNERPLPKFQQRRRIMTTRDGADYDSEEEEFFGLQRGLQGRRMDRQYNLEEHTLKYITHLPGDTDDDARRMRQYL